jgi:hypothetical protein
MKELIERLRESLDDTCFLNTFVGKADLKEAISALEAMQWAKCSERMPEITTKKHGMKVLAATQCICGDYEYCMDWFIDGAIYAKDGAWAFWNMDSPPTHWMPLPSPPLVDQEG